MHKTVLTSAVRRARILSVWNNNGVISSSSITGAGAGALSTQPKTPSTCTVNNNTSRWFASQAFASSSEATPPPQGSETSTKSASAARTSSLADSCYHIEVSNVARAGVTQIIVTGPGVLGLLASLCVTLATHGGSIRELHAADCMKEGGITPRRTEGGHRLIRDVITVVDYKTGHAFADSDLQPLAKALLKSVRAPTKVVSILKQEMDAIYEQVDAGPVSSGDITVVPKDRFRRL